MALSGPLSCAAPMTGGPPAQPPARAALQSEVRFFYDALIDYGDWVLIEPPGYVFRPRNNVIGWQPYQDGFWVPSDIYGWVWISSEPFGWVTYHYGSWIYDRFQGWVWVPGNRWGPAWVAWEDAGEYVGWAPLGARGEPAEVPGGAFQYVSRSQIASTDLKARTLRARDLGALLDDAKPLVNSAVRGGVTFNRGPDIDDIERAAGPLTRVRIDDLLPEVSPDTLTAGEQRARVDAAQRAGEQAAREARQVASIGSRPPSRLPVVRPLGVPRDDAPPPPLKPTPRDPKGRAAPADSTKR
jgi:hypothetical protein